MEIFLYKWLGINEKESGLTLKALICLDKNITNAVNLIRKRCLIKY